MSNDEQQLNTTFDGKQFQDVPQEIVDRANSYVQTYSSTRKALGNPDFVITDHRDGSEYLFSEWMRKGGPYPLMVDQSIDEYWIKAMSDANASTIQRIKNFIKSIFS